MDFRGLSVAEELKVAILLESVIIEEPLKSTAATLEAVNGDNATWDSVCSGCPEER